MIYNSIQAKSTILFTSVLLALMAIGFYGYHSYQNIVTKRLLVHNLTEQIVTTAYTTQVHFKKQVQEWKNVLIRGHDPDLFKKYWGQFNEEERITRSTATQLSNLLGDTSESKQLVDRFIFSHSQLSDKYSKALTSFSSAEDNPHILVDLQVRGIDREPTDLLDSVVEKVSQERTSKLALLSNEQIKVERTVLFIFIIVLVGALWFLFLLTDQKLRKPIVSAASIARRISAGHFDNDIEVKSDDEIGLLMKSLQIMQAQILTSTHALQEKERELQTITDDIADGILVIDNDQVIHFANPAAINLLGLESNVPKNSTTDVAFLLDSARETQFTNASSAITWLEKSVSDINWHGKQAYVIAVRDITSRRESEERLRFYSRVIESANEAFMITDTQGHIVGVNPAFTKITGYSETEALGKTPALLKSGRQDVAFYQHMWEALLGKGHWEGEIWDRRKDGEVYPKWLSITSVKDDEDNPTHFVGAFIDISERKAAEERIHNLAFYDSLTNLPNRRLLMERLTHAMIAGNRSQEYGALLFLDLDNFKALNDTQGHATGDQLLIMVGERLKRITRESDTVSRLGGDEFVILFEGLSKVEATAATQIEILSENIRIMIGQPFLFNTDDKDYHTTASIGLTLFLGQQTPADTLLKQADLALYQAKDAGRNTVHFFNPAMQEAVDAHTKMETALRKGIEQGELSLFYQPLVGAENNCIGAEGLLRWLPPGKKSISPAQFIPLAEETGLILPIGDWVLRTACAQIKNWEDNILTSHMVLSINISAHQFRQVDFVAQVEKIVSDSRIDPSHLKLELTESAVLDNVEEAVSRMNQLKAIGLKLSLDDFGTGYSSLAYLKQLPVEEVKIDRSFINDITDNPDDAAIVCAILAMSDSLGLSVVAEGVETELQLTYLSQNGCSIFQGYLFSRPMPAADFAQYIRVRHIPSGGAEGVEHWDRKT